MTEEPTELPSIRPIMVFTLTLLALTALHPMPPSAPPTAAGADESAVRALLSEFEEAWNRGDVDRLVAVYTDPHVDVNAPGQVLSSRETRAMLEALEPGRHYEIHIESDEVIVEGDRAFQRGTFVLTPSRRAATEGGAAVTKRYLEILERGEDGRWRVFWSMDGPISE